MQLINLAILRSEWMLDEASVNMLFQAAMDHLAGKTISAGLFSKISLPDVPDNIALIPVNGVMSKADICGGMGTRSIANMVNEAGADKSKTAVIMFFESVPGGQVDGTEELANAISTVNKTKPVISVVSGLCASAGVWAASGSSEIYCLNNTDMYGCIGTMTRIQKKSEADASYEVVYSDLSPDKNAEGRSQDVMKANVLNPTAKLFHDAVIKGRGDRLNMDGEGVLTGATFIASKAKKNGLIDGIMPFGKVVQRANYLSKKQNTNTMSKPGEGKAVFQNVLKAAKADAAVPVEEGFALSEDQMNTLDAHIKTTDASVVSLTAEVATATTALQTEKDARTTAEAALATANTAHTAAVTKFEERIVALGGKAAPTKDPLVKEGSIDPTKTVANKYLTSADIEKQAMTAKYGTN